MKIFLFLSTLYALLFNISAPKTTLPVEKRVEKLKSRLQEEIARAARLVPDSYAHSYEEQEDQKDFVLHPIMPSEDKYKHVFKPVRTVEASNNLVPVKRVKKRTTAEGHTHKSRNELRAELKEQTTPKSGFYLLNPLDIFYRRLLQGVPHESAIKWVQCQDLITPYFTGLKKEPTMPKKLGPQHPIPKKLFEALNTNVDYATKDDVFTMIYQISQLQIRLFQWDLMPIRILMNIFTNGKLHTFRNVKNGIKNMFKRWRLTIDNMTNILQSTKIIRPPCVETSRYSGSTKSNKVSKYKHWTSKATTKCDVDDWACDPKN